MQRYISVYYNRVQTIEYRVCHCCERWYNVVKYLPRFFRITKTTTTARMMRRILPPADPAITGNIPEGTCSWTLEFRRYSF